MRFEVRWGALAALGWGREDGRRMLCLHGWLDNAASWQPLAALLDGFNIVALEMAGHGHSDHRPTGTQYHLADHLFDVDAVLDGLGWDDCILVGHSMGAGVAACYAAAAPERVTALVLLDGLGPLAQAGIYGGQQLRRSLASVRQPRRLEKVYADVDAAAQARTRRMPMAMASARLLAERALQGEPGAWRWRTDPRLMWISPLRIVESQARELLAAIDCPTLVAFTAMAESFAGPALEPRLAVMRDVVFERVEGGHHFHMDDPVSTARMLMEFLNQPQRKEHSDGPA